jgi:hypothetical protein
MKIGCFPSGEEAAPRELGEPSRQRHEHRRKPPVSE